MSNTEGKKYHSGVELIGADELTDMLDDFSDSDGELMKIMRRATTRVVNQYVTPYIYEIAKNGYTITDATIDDTAQIKNKSNSGKGLYGRKVVVQANRIGLAKMDVIPKVPHNQKGIRVEDRIPYPIAHVKTDNMPKTMKGIIIAKMRSGHIGLFYKVKGEKANSKTLPNGKTVQYDKIKELISLSMSEMIREGLKTEDGTNLGVEEIRQELFKQIRKSVNKAKKRYQEKLEKA